MLEFFPDYRSKSKGQTIQEITLKHLLTMTAPYQYESEPYAQVHGSEDWVKAGLDLLGGQRKIGDFHYSTVGTQILSGVLQSATGKSTLEFAIEHLFIPLVISIPKSIKMVDEKSHRVFLKEKYVSGWIVDPQGAATTGWGLTLCPRDMAKIGQLYLNQGMWEGRQLIAKEWIEESTKEHSRCGERRYGYLWWLLDTEKDGSFAAFGNYGNTIYINPKEQIVIAIACHFDPKAKVRNELIWQYILPQIQSK